MKKILWVLLIFTIFFQGCDYKEIERRVLIRTLGIDYDIGEEEYIFLFRLTIFKGGNIAEAGSKEGESFLYETRGKSIGEGLNKLKALTDLEPEYSHLKTLFLGKTLVDTIPIQQILEGFIRIPDIQKIMWVNVAMPTAREVLSMNAYSEKLAGGNLFLRFGKASDSPYTRGAHLYEIYRDAVTPGLTPYCAILEYDKENKEFLLNKSIIFSDKGTTALVLSPMETEIMSLLQNETNIGYLASQYKEKLPIGVLITSSKSKSRFIKRDKEDLVYEFNIKLRGALSEGVSSDKSFTKETKEIFEKQIEGRAESLLNKFKENNIDTLRLQEKYWLLNPKYELSREWLSELLPKIRFKVNVNLVIESSGGLK